MGVTGIQLWDGEAEEETCFSNQIQFPSSRLAMVSDCVANVIPNADSLHSVMRWPYSAPISRNGVTWQGRETADETDLLNREKER